MAEAGWRTGNGPEACGLVQLREMAVSCRRMIEPGLLGWGEGKAAIDGACLHASVLLAVLLLRFTNLQVQIRGGDGERQEGAVDSEGRWRGHYWAVVRGVAGLDGTAEVLVDLTADQFGFEKVRVGMLDAIGHMYRAGQVSETEHAAAALAAEFGAGDVFRAC